MRKLQQLTAYLEEHAGLDREQVQSFADRGELYPTGSDLGHGVELGRFKYDALIQIENYSGDADVLLLLILAWISEHDTNRDEDGLADPETDISLNDQDTADIDIAVEFEEGLQIVPDENGPIPFDGRQWRVSDVPIDVAEELENLEPQGDVAE
ncbi:phage tail protein (plasmid) [Halodesulfovibrio aestuarii]|uniref:P2 phage tail completion protein R (GpR) n=1 Tax=Halodesulfovibrio aestuarii TaxID=126333 RepID=A0A8G2CC45_9BACT|nr:phage tail protein [Halodesulfovibrio aestuarii]SHJ71998.1 P2 phage tail completion protein R (GpR) [Halodesulfovibrio aestuarii]